MKRIIITAALSLALLAPAALASGVPGAGGQSSGGSSWWTPPAEFNAGNSRKECKKECYRYAEACRQHCHGQWPKKGGGEGKRRHAHRHNKKRDRAENLQQHEQGDGGIRPESKTFG